MNARKLLLVCVLIVIFVISFSACGNKNNKSSESESSQPGVEIQITPEGEVVEQVISTPDPGTSADSLTGNWIDVTASDRFVNITKTDSGYQYEDNEGKLPATFENGALKVIVSETETADIHIDTQTGNLIFVYLDNISEYKKK